MKILLATLGFVMAGAAMAVGQAVSVALALDQEKYLPGEAVTVKVRITNDSGQILQFGTDDSWLSFRVEDADHFLVARQGSVPVIGEFTLDPGKIATKKVDLAPYYDLVRIGRYFVTATVSLPQWGQVIQSKAISFDIIAGSNLWEKDFGVPTLGHQSDSAPEVRRYALVQTLHHNTLSLYFRLTDALERKIFRIIPLGQIVSFSNLEAQMDQFSNLHVLYQTGARSFVHCLINPDGVLIGRETYECLSTKPFLRRENDGRITVAGGTRRVGANDLP
jgi:hypothetical protein